MVHSNHVGVERRMLRIEVGEGCLRVQPSFGIVACGGGLEIVDDLVALVLGSGRETFGLFSKASDRKQGHTAMVHRSAEVGAVLSQGNFPEHRDRYWHVEVTEG